MFSTFNSIRRSLLTAGSVLALLGLVAFTEMRHGQKRVGAVLIRLNPVDGHSFLTKRDVMRYLTSGGADPVTGEFYRDVDFRQLEARLHRHGLVKSCQVSRDLTGNLLVEVEQPRPLARLLATEGDGQLAQGRYVGEDGRFFPVSMNYSARVPILTGGYFAKNRSLAGGHKQPLLTLLQRIHDDPFWRAQITDVAVNERGEVTMRPEVGNHQIELGQPTDLDAKLEKLKLFYTDVLPAKGWNRYHRVNVQYRNQIVCE